MSEPRCNKCGHVMGLAAWKILPVCNRCVNDPAHKAHMPKGPPPGPCMIANDPVAEFDRLNKCIRELEAERVELRCVLRDIAGGLRPKPSVLDSATTHFRYIKILDLPQVKRVIGEAAAEVQRLKDERDRLRSEVIDETYTAIQECVEANCRCAVEPNRCAACCAFESFDDWSGQQGGKESSDD